MVLVAYKPINPIVLAGLLVMAMHFLHAGRKRVTLPGAEESMTTTIEFITALFCQVDDHLSGLPKHPEARLWPSEVVTLGLLHALKGVGNRPFYRWLTRDYRALFPRLPERTRLFRLLKTHQDWTQVFLAAPTVLAMLTVVLHFKKVMHRVWASFQARLAFTMAAFNVLVQWHGFQPNASGFVPLSIAEFSL